MTPTTLIIGFIQPSLMPSMTYSNTGKHIPEGAGGFQFCSLSCILI